MAETSSNPQIVAFKQMADGLSREELTTKLGVLNGKNFKAQTQWFLNAMWECPPVMLQDNPDTCVEIYRMMAKCIELSPKGEAGSEVDEFGAHRLFEAFGEPMSVQQMREALASVDIDFNRQVSLTEFLIHKFQVDWPYLVVAQPGNRSTKLIVAQRKLAQANEALKSATEAEAAARAEVTASEEASAQAVTEREASEKAVADSAAARTEVEQAQSQQESALGELQAREKTAAAKISDLQTKAEDGSLSTVKRNKARAELAQCKSEDDLELRTVRIQQEATLRKVTKAVRHAGEAEVAAAAANKRADEAVAKSTRVRARAGRAAEDAQEKKQAAEAVFKETAAALQEAVAAGSGDQGGAMWLLQYELEEAKKRLPTRRLSQQA